MSNRGGRKSPRIILHRGFDRRQSFIENLPQNNLKYGLSQFIGHRELIVQYTISGLISEFIIFALLILIRHIINQMCTFADIGSFSPNYKP